MNYFAGRLSQLLCKKQICTKNALRFFSQSLNRNNEFKSAYALDNLYPNSNMKIHTPTFTPLDPNEKFSGFIPMKELQVTYSHSSGPGGMNVNSTNTKVDLRFHVQSAKWLSDEIKEKLMIAEKRRMNKEGFLVIKCETTRVQNINLAHALHRLREMIRKCTVEAPPVSPETEERLRHQRIKAARERILQKRMRSEIKRTRSDCNID